MERARSADRSLPGRLRPRARADLANRPRSNDRAQRFLLWRRARRALRVAGWGTELAAKSGAAQSRASTQVAAGWWWTLPPHDCARSRQSSEDADRNVNGRRVSLG